MSSLRLIPLDDAVVFPGMNITLTTTANNDEEGRELLKGLGFPLRVPGGDK